MSNKKNYRGMKPLVQLCAKGGSCEQLNQLDMVTTNEICICREQKDFDVRNFANMETAVQYKNAIYNFNWE